MIRNKLILAYLLPTVIVLVLVGVVIYTQARASLEQELGSRLISVAEATVGSLPSGEPRRLAKLSKDDEATLKRLRTKLEAVRQATGVRRVFLSDPELRSLADTRSDVAFGDDLFDLQADRFEMERVLKPPGSPASSVLFTGKDGVRYKNGYAPIIHEGQVVAILAVEGSAEFFAVVGEFQALMLIAGLLSLLIIVLVSVWVARSINEPIMVLETAARRFGRGDLSTDVQVEGKDEFSVLATAFNDMRQDLLDRDRQMQMMLSGIAHEVRNPLGGMELFCGLMSEELEEMGDQPHLTEYNAKITRELHYLKRVVNDFLDYARRKPLEVTRFEAKGLLSDVAMLMSRDMTQASVKLAVGPMDPGLEVTADRETLHRVLINLIRNAWQASKPGTQITIGVLDVDDASVEALSILAPYDANVFLPPQAEHTGRWRAIYIQDQGSGIAKEKLETIFEAFFTTKEKGSGLGLALTTKVVEEHGGALAVASTLRPSNGSAEALSFDEPEPSSMSGGMLGDDLPASGALMGMLGDDMSPGMLGDGPMLGDDSQPGLLGDDVSSGMLGDGMSAGMLGDDSSPGMLGDTDQPAMLGADDSLPGMLGDDEGLGMLGDESEPGMLGDDEPAMLGVEPLSEQSPASPLAASDADGQVVGTVMVVLLPFKEEIEPAKMVIPEGWLG